MFHRILVASDLSDSSRPALRMALQLGSDMNASVVVLHVTDDGSGEVAAVPTVDRMPTFGFLAPTPRPRGDGKGRRNERETRKDLEKQTASEVPGGRLPPTEAIVRSGPIPETILSMAEAGEADLIVIGAGRAPGRLGETAAQVVRLSGRPVLSVPPEGMDQHDETEDRDIHDPGSAYDRLESVAVRRT